MPVRLLPPLAEAAFAIRQLARGRTNVGGSVTLATSTTTTTVTNTGIQVGDVLKLIPQTANAAAALATTYVTPATQAEQITITHANNAQNDRTFGYVVTEI